MDFTIVLRGYDRPAVDDLVHRIAAARASDSPSLRTEVGELVRTVTLPVVFRGYGRPQVDAYLRRAAQDLA